MSSTISTLYIFEWKCGRAGSAPTRPTYASVSPNRGYAVERRHFDVEKAARREIEELVVVSDAVGSGDDAVPRVVDRLSVEQVQSRSQREFGRDMKRAMKFRAIPSKSTWKRGNGETSEASVEIVHGEGDVGVEAERGGGELARVAPAAEVAHDDAVCMRREGSGRYRG